jgi:hypothetical protein
MPHGKLFLTLAEMLGLDDLCAISINHHLMLRSLVSRRYPGGWSVHGRTSRLAAPYTRHNPYISG